MTPLSRDEKRISRRCALSAALGVIGGFLFLWRWSVVELASTCPGFLRAWAPETLSVIDSLLIVWLIWIFGLFLTSYREAFYWRARARVMQFWQVGQLLSRPKFMPTLAVFGRGWAVMGALLVLSLADRVDSRAVVMDQHGTTLPLRMADAGGDQMQPSEEQEILREQQQQQQQQTQGSHTG